MTSTFPTTTDFDRLIKMPDEEVAVVYQSLVITERQSRCCQWHGDRVRPPEPEWYEAVHCEMEVRDLSTDITPPDEGANCPTCGSKHETVDDPKAFMHTYRVCRSCKTRRKLGDNVDCRTGQPEPLPKGW